MAGGGRVDALRAAQLLPGRRRSGMSKKTGKTARETAGFSLIELVIVLAVMAIVAAMAIPTWQRMQKNARLNGDGHSLSEALSVAKLRAAANFTESRVFLFTGTDKTPYF